MKTSNDKNRKQTPPTGKAPQNPRAHGSVRPGKKSASTALNNRIKDTGGQVSHQDGLESSQRGNE